MILCLYLYTTVLTLTYINCVSSSLFYSLYCVQYCVQSLQNTVGGRGMATNLDAADEHADGESEEHGDGDGAGANDHDVIDGQSHLRSRVH